MSYKEKYLKYKKKYLDCMKETKRIRNSNSQYYNNNNDQYYNNNDQYYYTEPNRNVEQMYYNEPRRVRQMYYTDSRELRNDSDNNDKFKQGDRFYNIHPINGIEYPTGTVLHRRNMYGDNFGGTYMVKYDNIAITEHNANGNHMVKI